MRGHGTWLLAPGPSELREARCPGCGSSWEVEGHAEYGLWLPERNDDLTCEGCGAEGEA